jgi:YHS domain-containing protein
LLRLTVLLAAILLLRWLWRWFWAVGWKRLFRYAVERMERMEPPRSAPAVHHGAVKLDPECGTYVDEAVAVQESSDGETLYFCSERCRDAYHARRQHLAHKTG